jgi:Tfp pilus assembly protein PilO
MKLTEKKLLVLTIIIPAIIAVGLAGVGFFKFNKNISALKKEIIEIGKKIDGEKVRRAKMDELSSRLKKLEAEQSSLEALLPTKEEMSYEKFINTLTRFSREAGVKLTSATPVGDKGGPPAGQPSFFDSISYALALEGDFFQVINYIYLLETYQRFIKVDNFSVRPIGGQVTSDAPAIYGLNLKITSYLYKKPQTK